MSRAIRWPLLYQRRSCSWSSASAVHRSPPEGSVRQCLRADSYLPGSAPLVNLTARGSMIKLMLLL